MERPNPGLYILWTNQTGGQPREEQPHAQADSIICPSSKKNKYNWRNVTSCEEALAPLPTYGDASPPSIPLRGEDAFSLLDAFMMEMAQNKKTPEKLSLHVSTHEGPDLQKYLVSSSTSPLLTNSSRFWSVYSLFNMTNHSKLPSRAIWHHMEL